MAEASLIAQNPWWLDGAAIYNDRNIKRATESPVTWTPRLFHLIDMDVDAVYTLRGPRQVGKTTLVKLLMKKLVENGVEGRRLFYWTCDLEQGPKDLHALLNSYIETTRRIHYERLYIFLDEISTVKNWQNTIKYMYDLGKLEKTTLILTGSHSIDIKYASEKLPGRRGDAAITYDKVLVPMKFSEYVEIRDKELSQLLRKNNLLNYKQRSNVIYEIGKGHIPREITELNLFFERINSLFNDYLVTGGIINAINHYDQKRTVPTSLYADYVNSTMGDITSWQKRELYLAQILNAIIDKMPFTLSWNSIRDDTDVGSSATIAEYVDLLKASYVLCPIYKIDRRSGGPNIRKEKKIHFLDPFIFHSLNSWVKQKPPFELCMSYLADPTHKSHLVESVVGDHLIRFMYNRNPSDMYAPSRNVFYWDDGNSEVDYVLKLDEDYLGLEVKYQNQIVNKDYKGLNNFWNPRSEYTGVLLSKNELKVHNDITTIPIPLFLVLV